MDKKEIRSKIYALKAARQEYLKIVMQKYDKEGYYPMLKVLQDRCEELGHTRGEYHSNGLGWGWFYCATCGKAFDKRKQNDY